MAPIKSAGSPYADHTSKPRRGPARRPTAKTVNKALVTLVVGLNHAVEDGLIAANPALGVRRLPSAHIEREFLRLEEIPRYLDACSGVYRRLAELLIGSGLRISEALGLRVGDLELEATRGTIVVYRSRNNESVGLTKSDRFRSVQIGHYYGHLERHVLGAGALATGDAITRAAVRQR